MSERYQHVFTGSENLYVNGAPIVIRACALLKDTETGKMIAQLKLRNVSGKQISYAKVAITQLDSIHQPIDKAIAFEYLDLAVNDQEEFGNKKPLPLPNSSTRAFQVSVSHVAFTDGTIWAGESIAWQGATADSAIATKITAAETYKQAKALSQSNSKDEVNRAKALLESISTIQDVTAEISLCLKKLAAFEEEERAAEQKAKAAEEKRNQAKQRNKKMIKVASLVFGICIVLGLLGYFVGYPLISSLTGDYAPYIQMYHVKEFKVPEGVTAISDDAFSYCKSLESITIPDSVTSIGNWAFAGCSLTSITIPDSVTSIGEGAFCNCTSLTSITIPDSVTSIGDYAFDGCTSLTSITIPDSVTSIGDRAFYGCTSLASITIGNSVTSIDDSAFEGCTSLTSITIPDSVTSIGNDAFYFCKSLASITIGNNVTSIGGSAFTGCMSLTSITIPDSVTSIGDHVFEGCTRLEPIYYTGTPEEWANISIGSSNVYLTSTTRYYYSETQPTDTTYKYWHYVDGVPTPW